MNSSPWKFKRYTNTIEFTSDYIEVSNPSYINKRFLSKSEDNSCCTINISVEVKPMKTSKKIDYWYFDLTYSHRSRGKYGIDQHPLTSIINRECIDEDIYCLYEGIIVAANPITFNMVNVLLSDNPDELANFTTGSRPFVHYQGEIMRALIEFEN